MLVAHAHEAVGGALEPPVERRKEAARLAVFAQDERAQRWRQGERDQTRDRHRDRDGGEAKNAAFFPRLAQEHQAGRGLVLLDGLDEVPEADHRREQIRQAVQDFATTVGTSRVVITSRTYAYQNQAWRLPGFCEAILAPFSEGQIARFVGLWYEQQVALGRMTRETASERSELLRRAIFGNDRLLALAERPPASGSVLARC